MARIIKTLSTDKKWHGPCPDKSGEFCGNSHKSQLTITPEGIVTNIRSEVGREQELIPETNKRIGKPSNCKAGSSQKMEDDGYVGLYLINNSVCNIGTYREIETDALQEEVVSGQRPPAIPFDNSVLQEP